MTVNAATPDLRGRIGFIGLGVMGAPMARHIHETCATQGSAEFLAWDAHAHTREALAKAGLPIAASRDVLMEAVDQIHVCLPGGTELAALCDGADGLVAHARTAQCFIDHGTSPVALTRKLAAAAAERGATFADAPITRTRAAAEAGTLVVLFGGTSETLRAARPAMETFAEEIFHCGDVGAGQIVKQMNNMVLIQTVVAISEALATAEAAGLDAPVLFDALEAGSGDSFALRNHGRKAILADTYPERAFSARYALKDMDYAIALARDGGLELEAARVAKAKLEAAIAAGDGDAYWPVLHRLMARQNAG